MLRQVEATGKSIEKAIENGLKELNTTMENVDIKILNEGGLLKKAKVLITLSEEEKTTKVEEVKVEEVKVEEELEELECVCENGVCELKPKKENKESVETTEIVETKKENKEVDLEEIVKVAEEFLNGLVYILNLEAKVEHTTDSKLPQVKLTGDDLGVLIGYRGDTLEAIQNLINVIVANKTGFKGKVILDIENYRERRIQTLCDLADRISKQVVKNKKSFKLEPMNSYERRIIHSHLQNVEHITTHSEGKEPERYLVVDYVE